MSKHFNRDDLINQLISKGIRKHPQLTQVYRQAQKLEKKNNFTPLDLPPTTLYNKPITLLFNVFEDGHMYTVYKEATLMVQRIGCTCLPYVEHRHCTINMVTCAHIIAVSLHNVVAQAEENLDYLKQVIHRLDPAQGARP